MILAASLLFLYNQNEDQQAGIVTSEIVLKMKDSISSYEALAYEDDLKMNIDGYDYIGYLSIPKLELDLPIMDEWDYDRLKIAPCRQYGSIKGDDLVIAAHNYSNHFGFIGNLKIGDFVQFSEVNGNISYYLVDNVEVISPYDIEKVKSGQWELVMYTCTYSATHRIMVGCRKVPLEVLESLTE